MFNVTVVRLKDLGKYLFTLFIMFVIIFIVKRYFFENNIIAEIKGKTVLDAKSEKINFNDNYAKILSNILPAINEKKEDTKEKEPKGIKLYNTLIGLQLGMVKVEEKNKEVEVAKDEKKEESKTKTKDKEKVELPKSGEKTEVTTKNPIVDSSNFEYEGVKIKNETKYSLNKSIFKNKEIRCKFSL